MVNNISKSKYAQQLVKFAKNNLSATVGIMFVIGILTGWLMFGWWLFPVVWEDADPESLHPHYMSEWVQMSADSYVLTTDIDKAQQRVDWLGEKSLNYIEYARVNALGPEQLRIAQLQSALEVVTESKEPVSQTNQVDDNKDLKEVEKDESGSGLFDRSILISVLGGLAVIGVMSSVGYYAFKYIGLKSKRDLEIAPQYVDNGVATGDEENANVMTPPDTDTLVSDRGAPLSRFMTTYLLGDDLYDDSFGIDDANGDFLGECGMGISDIIGVGEPKKVCAFEIWLFDKNDVRTVTKVLMSEDAFSDEAKRASLAPKGEPVLAESGKEIILETASLHVSARVVDMQYGGGPLPQNSFFNQLTVELSAWRKG
ncbi:MAG: hypothetical protein CL789_03960 [Chloroflexi bacterium]|nr:hypothetical protein [Chloroflexota bacterium]